MSLRFLSGILLLIFALTACKRTLKEEMQLNGNWQASQMKLGDSLLNIQYELITLKILPHHRYAFTNNLNQTEAGIFEIRDSLLLLNDTTGTGMREKALHILQLNKDSLLLRQNYQGRDARLLMRRVK